MPLIPTYLARLNNWQVLSETFVGGSAPGSFTEDDLDQFRSAWNRDDAMETMVAWYQADNSNIAEPESRQVDIPTMILIAPNDNCIPSDLTARSMPYLNNGELVRLETGSYWIIQEQPELIAEYMLEFFRR